MSDEPSFDPLFVLRALTHAGVKFVVIGGVAARLHGSPSLTRDVDICHATSRVNLRRLAVLLRDLDARLRGAEDEVPFLLDAKTLAAGSNFTFTTRAGDIDVLGMPAGVGGYDELAASAEMVQLDDLVVPVASLDDLIRMKRASGRPKDLIEVEILEAIKHERP